jgi:predicted TIM-barrel fold metal-dependent hydrolase
MKTSRSTSPVIRDALRAQHEDLQRVLKERLPLLMKKQPEGLTGPHLQLWQDSMMAQREAFKAEMASFYRPKPKLPADWASRQAIAAYHADVATVERATRVHTRRDPPGAPFSSRSSFPRVPTSGHFPRSLSRMPTFFAAAPVRDTYIDVHSHHIFSGTAAEMDSWAADLVAFMDRNGVYRTVISGLTAGDLAGSGELDEIVLTASSAYPDYFIPFARDFDLDSADAPTEVEAALVRGFQGIGELIVHGHQGNHDDMSIVSDIARIASDWGVPLLLHWDVGEVDALEYDKSADLPVSVDTLARRAKNLRDLDDLLTDYPDLKVILAHCGAGPAQRDSHGREIRDLTWYEETVLPTLLDHANLYMDIAGMFPPRCSDLWKASPHIDPFTKSPEDHPSGIGWLILELMGKYSDRFLVGFDIEDNTVSASDSDWDEALAHYVSFLDLSGHAADIAYYNAYLLLDLV